MKNYGSTFEYEEKRNRELLKAFRNEVANATFVQRDEILNKVVNRPASRFWVSEERASIVMANMLRGDTLDNMRPLKREMFQEIFRRFLLLRQQHPNLSIYKLTSIAVSQPAPKFYLTAGSAKVILSKIRNSWYEKRKRR